MKKFVEMDFKKDTIVFVTFLSWLSVIFPVIAESQEKSDAIFYSSLNNAIQLGQFDGVASLKELKTQGDFGLGSQHALAGELVLDGKAYKISVDGRAVPMPDTVTLPFAATKFFNAEKKWTVQRSMDLRQLEQFLDSVINTNLFSAIKVSGSFQSVKYKCYFPQQKPYPPIRETPAKFFDSASIKGTMVGFFTPRSALVLNSPNYHFHFINDLLTSGGHLENMMSEKITIEVDYANNLQVKLPGAESLKQIDLNVPPGRKEGGERNGAQK